MHLPKIEAAKMWVTKEINEFKEDMKKSKDNVIHIGSLATATVSVKQHGPYVTSITNMCVCLIV